MRITCTICISILIGIIKLFKYAAILLVLFYTFPAIEVNGQVNRDFDHRRWLSKKPVIDKIIIEGNSVFPDAKIKSSLFSRESNIFRAINKDRRRRVQRETLMKDTSEIKFLYFSSGYLGVQIEESFEPLPDDSNALIRIVINEGRQFYYGDFDFTGNNSLRNFWEFRQITNRFIKGEPVDPFALKQALYDIKSVHANNGYPYAYAEYTIDTCLEDSYADVTFDTQSDSLVHFGDTKIIGAVNFDTSFILREMTFRKGDLYRRKDIIESQKRLLNTGHYITLQLKNIFLDSSTSYDRLNPDFILGLQEKKSHYVSIKTGAAQDSLKDLIWNFSASWGKRNFLRSRQIEFTTRTTFEIFTDWRLLEHNYRVRITEPWFLGTRMPLTLTGQYEPGVRSPVLDYRIQTWSISATTTRTIKEKLRILTGFQYEAVNIYGVSKAAEEQTLEDQGISIRRKLHFNIVRDSRKDIFIPKKGSVTQLGFEYIGGFLGGDDSFFLIEASWSRYQRFWPGWIAATRLKAGFMHPIGESVTVPVNDRYYIGGANTIRGFSEKDLGPKSELGTPTGADIILIINQEFRYPIVSKFWGSIFMDIGNGYRNRADIKFNNLAVSYGVGFQFLSPAGPIRLDYARRVKVKGINSGYKFHFTILYAF